jgi:hypothetical protein
LAPHFVYLAEAFLQGRLDLVHVPLPPYDLTLFGERWYVSFPPLPALLMLPLVAIWGLSVSDIAFGVVAGAVTVGLFYLVMLRLRERRGVPKHTSPLWFCLLLGLGTTLWPSATLGSVWFTAHVVAVACLCLYLLEVLGRNRPVWAGVWLGLGFLARAPVLLAFPLALIVHVYEGRPASMRQRARDLLTFGGRVMAGTAPWLLGQMGYNWLRFGHLMEFGYQWMNSPETLLARQSTWGQFSLHFLPENLYTMLIRPPLLSCCPPRVAPDPWGMGLLLSTPALICSLGTLHRESLQRPLVIGLWSSVVLVAVPSLLYFNTGSFQFGYRFALDWLPLGVLLAALGADARPSLRPWGKALVLASVLMHAWGVLWMYPTFHGQSWLTQMAGWLAGAR